MYSHFKRGRDFCNFNHVFEFKELENCNKKELINWFLLNTRFLLYRYKIEKAKPNIMLYTSTFNSLKKSEYLTAIRIGDLEKNIFENGIFVESYYYCTYMCFTTLVCNDNIIFILISLDYFLQQ